MDLIHDTSRNSIHRHDIGICRYNIGLRLFATPLPKKVSFIRQCFAFDIQWKELSQKENSAG